MNKRVMMSLALASLMGGAAANAGEEDLVKYRHYLMESIGGHMNNIVAIVKGEVPYRDNLVLHAEHLAALAPKALPAFETEAMSDKSEALPAIWEDWEKFQERSQTFERAAADFSQAAASGEMARIGPALGKLGDSCKGCHDDFMEDH